MKPKKVYVCTDCGNDTVAWQGQCPACGAWNTLSEMKIDAPAKGASIARSGAGLQPFAPKKLAELSSAEEERIKTHISEFDRVLGGGIVRGSIVLVGGSPGIGKSTLLLQICGSVPEKTKVLYVSGEESERQLKMRADRLSLEADSLYVLTETNIEEIIAAATEAKPDILIADSIQTLYNPSGNSSPGSVTQVKDCAMSLMRFAKASGCAVFLVGHVNKEGAIAGPLVLEHMVDSVLQFEGDRQTSYRILRAKKNRFGSTNEIGVFEMNSEGLKEVLNPSEEMLSGRPKNTPGTCVTCVCEGSRQLLAEVQALAAPTSLNNPRRVAQGIEYSRALMLLAVAEKRAGLRVSGCDCYFNVIGGLELAETGADLATVLALASSYRDVPVGDDIVAIGEVGLTGELRSTQRIADRVVEAQRLGFARAIVPRANRGKFTPPEGIEVLYARNIVEALKITGVFD
ncbi:MAG: DNA repair protein RadA [Oscillospiraceae bacterium]|jgi:DNA repair protein RadA/Sms|nr:DNA repair protein RadA [Oscillospiraceae bacterium]